MHLRQPFVRKHICSFALTHADYVNSREYMVERTCTDCDKVQCAVVPVPLTLPQELLVYSDVDWMAGPMSAKF